MLAIPASVRIGHRNICGDFLRYVQTRSIDRPCFAAVFVNAYKRIGVMCVGSLL